MASTLATNPAPVAHTAITREAAYAGHPRHYEKTGELATVTVFVTVGRCLPTNVRSKRFREGRKYVTGKEELVMVRKNEGPSLQGLARRLEALERENAELRGGSSSEGSGYAW
jgi:hypothetical protein